MNSGIHIFWNKKSIIYSLKKFLWRQNDITAKTWKKIFYNSENDGLSGIFLKDVL